MRSAVVVRVLTLLMLLPVTGQAQAVGSIAGSITDTSGRPIPGATITIVSDTDEVRTTVTDESGRYGVGGLPPGSHRIEARMNGFESKVSVIAVSSGRVADWGGALLIGSAIGEGSIERKVARHTGTETLDCGRHGPGASASALEASLTCASNAVRDGQPFSVIVQSIARGTHGGNGLLAGSDGVIQIFHYDRGGLRFEARPCSAPRVTPSPSGSGFAFTCARRRR